MGWTFIRSSMSMAALLSSRLDGDKVKAGRIKDHPNYSGVAYLAYETENRGTIAVVVLLDRKREEIGYKLMDETVHPYFYDCPEEILNMLTDPPPNYGALQWRHKCWLNVAQERIADRLDAVLS